MPDLDSRLMNRDTLEEGDEQRQAGGQLKAQREAMKRQKKQEEQERESGARSGHKPSRTGPEASPRFPEAQKSAVKAKTLETGSALWPKNRHWHQGND